MGEKSNAYKILIDKLLGKTPPWKTEEELEED
jgi:hypothetical protein